MTPFSKRDEAAKEAPRPAAPLRDDRAHEKAEAHPPPKPPPPSAWLVRCAGCGETYRVGAEREDVPAHEVKRGWTCVGSGHSGAVVAVRSHDA